MKLTVDPGYNCLSYVVSRLGWIDQEPTHWDIEEGILGLPVLRFLSLYAKHISTLNFDPEPLEGKLSILKARFPTDWNIITFSSAGKRPECDHIALKGMNSYYIYHREAYSQPEKQANIRRYLLNWDWPTQVDFWSLPEYSLPYNFLDES